MSEPEGVKAVRGVLVALVIALVFWGILGWVVL